jgi:phenylacetate-coenzyme A ligase PaaK-like adenylate-forming protein
MQAPALKRTPLEAWIAGKIAASPSLPLRPEELAAYQLQKLCETIEYASHCSPFYREKLSKFTPAELKSISDLARFPFTSCEELRDENPRFLAVSQDEISRVVTLSSSGTTGRPKRVFFTADDQQLAVDFFQCGTKNLAAPGDPVMVLLPWETPGSIGDLLAEGISRSGAVPVRHGMISSLGGALERLTAEKIDSVIGLPVQVFALARYAQAMGASPRLRSVALVSDHVPACIVAELKRLWHCEVFQHYGATEMGLGGGVDCQAHAGYHLREADLYFEIVDPESGKPVLAGEPGEVVFTTLTRRGMPLIRYRTGDLSRMLTAPCACGSLLRRMEPLKSRDSVRLGSPKGPGSHLTMAMLDEALFPVPGVIEFEATLRRGQGLSTLTIAAQSVHSGPGADPVSGPANPVEQALRKALGSVDAIDCEHRAGRLDLDIGVRYGVDALQPRAEKRMITEAGLNGEQGNLPYPPRQDSARG